MAAPWPNWPIASFWRWRGTRRPGEVLSHAIDLLSPVSDRILGTVLTRVDLSRLQFYDYYRSSAYLKPYGTAGLNPGAAR